MENKDLSQMYFRYRPKAISSSLSSFSRFHDSPELLVEAGLELHKRVEHHKLKHGEDKNYLFFKKIERAMLRAFNFINDIKLIYERNQIIEHEIKYLCSEIENITKELNFYRTIEEGIESETFEEKIEIVKLKINKDHE